MVKKLQALKAKKGFTLVELIVVIAIIGVLAAILIPTLASQITKSKVTSADSTAKELVQTVNAWIADDVAQGGAEKVAAVLPIKMKGGVCADITPAAIGTSRTASDPSPTASEWLGKKTTTTANGNAAGIAESLKERIQADYSTRTFYAEIFVDVTGYAVFATYIPDTNEKAQGLDLPDAKNFAGAQFKWKSDKKEGVLTSGQIVGTSPKLTYGTTEGTVSGNGTITGATTTTT